MDEFQRLSKVNKKLEQYNFMFFALVV